MSAQTQWSSLEKYSLRFFTAFFLLLIVPLDPKFFSSLSSFSERADLFYFIFRWINYAPKFISGANQIQFVDLVGIAAIAVLIAFLWGFVQKKNTNNDSTYQALRIVLRYKLGAVLFTYGIIKVFALQIPYPTLSQLNTPYGDFTPAKIVELTMGVAKANYQQGIGFAELFAALLLLCRKTAVIGALAAAGTLLNVVLAAFAYKTGDEYLSAYLFGIALFLIAYGVSPLFNLMLEKAVQPKLDVLTLTPKQNKWRLFSKTFYSISLIIFAIATYFISAKGGYAYPSAKGLEESFGFYNVADFKVNGEELPYSFTDAKRWKNVVFEKWATLSIEKGFEKEIDTTVQLIKKQADLDRTFESSGNARRTFYSYTIDEDKRLLTLTNKANKQEKIVLNYNRPTAQTIVLSGKINTTDTVYVVLKKIEKKYLLQEGRRKPIAL